MNKNIKEAQSDIRGYDFEKANTRTQKAPKLTHNGDRSANNDPDPFNKEMDEEYTVDYGNGGTFGMLKVGQKFIWSSGDDKTRKKNIMTKVSAKKYKDNQGRTFQTSSKSGIEFSESIHETTQKNIKTYKYLHVLMDSNGAWGVMGSNDKDPNKGGWWMKFGMMGIANAINFAKDIAKGTSAKITTDGSLSKPTYAKGYTGPRNEGYNSGSVAYEDMKNNSSKLNVPKLPPSQKPELDDDTPFEEEDRKEASGSRPRKENLSRFKSLATEDTPYRVNTTASDNPKDEDKIINPDDAEDYLDETYNFKSGSSIKYNSKPWTVKTNNRDFVELEDKRGLTTIIYHDDIKSVKGNTIMTNVNERHEFEEISRMNRLLGEATRSKYTILHNSFTSAVQEAEDYTQKNGYEIDEDDWFHNITTGRGKPRDGDTFSTHITLSKGGKIQKRMLHIQVYNRGEGTKVYELNCYIA